MNNHKKEISIHKKDISEYDDLHTWVDPSLSTGLVKNIFLSSFFYDNLNLKGQNKSTKLI